MSRIDEALKRITGAAAEPRLSSILDRFSPEKASKLEDTRVSNSVIAGPQPVEARPSASQRASESSPRRAPESSPQRAPESPVEAPPTADRNIEPKTDTEKLVDLGQLADYARFFAGSLRRHTILAMATFALALAMTAATAVLLPRTYHAETKLLAQRNAVMAALSNPGRAVPWDADAPTRAAAETVLRRDNLISLARRTDVVAEWERTRVPILKLKDWLKAFVLRRRPLTPDEKLDELVTLLDARMMVAAGPVGDGTVSIGLDWPDAQMAYRLVQEAQQAFIDARQVAETTAIGESIGILERYSATLHDDINRTMTELQRTQQRRPAAGAPRSAAASARRWSAPSVTAALPPVPAGALGSTAVGAELNDPELRRLKAAIALKRQELAGLEEARQRQISELQARLAQLTTVYTTTHPTVMNTQQNIATLSNDSPQITALKTQMENLEAEYQQRETAAEEVVRQEDQLRAETTANRTAASDGEPAPRVREALPQPPAPPEPVSAPGGEADFTAIRLRLELNQLESVLERTDGARIELAVSQAAFKYRYVVIRPAQVPKVPVRPNVSAVLMAGFLASLMLACAGAVGMDLVGNRILEHWQVERQLGLPVLGTLRTV
jgi:hypothetical protein